MAKPKVVFDTNVFVRALINPKGINARIIASLDRYILVTSEDIVEEVAGVLARPEVLGVATIRKVGAERLLELLRRAPMVSPANPVMVFGTQTITSSWKQLLLQEQSTSLPATRTSETWTNTRA